MLVGWKSVIVVTIGFTKFAKILIEKIKSNEIINNIFVNLFLENEEMHSIIAPVCKKWSRHINKESVQK